MARQWGFVIIGSAGVFAGVWLAVTSLGSMEIDQKFVPIICAGISGIIALVAMIFPICFNPAIALERYKQFHPAVTSLKEALASHSLVYTNALCNPTGMDAYQRSLFKTYAIFRSLELVIPPRVKKSFVIVMNGYETSLNGANEKNPVNDYAKFVETCRKQLAC